MSALRTIREEAEIRCFEADARLRQAEAEGTVLKVTPGLRAEADLHVRVLLLLEKYAPEMVQREAEEQSGERKVRVTLTAEEARANLELLAAKRGVFPPRGDVARALADKLDAALKSLNPPEILESSDREDEG